METSIKTEVKPEGKEEKSAEMAHVLEMPSVSSSLSCSQFSLFKGMKHRLPLVTAYV